MKCPHCDVNISHLEASGPNVQIAALIKCRDGLALDLRMANAGLKGVVKKAEEYTTKLSQMQAALLEMRTTYKLNQHAREWAEFIETFSPKLPTCDVCGEDFDPVFGKCRNAYHQQNPTCVCAGILQTDERRHFKECPLRAKYPDPPAEKP